MFGFVGRVIVTLLHKNSQYITCVIQVSGTGDSSYVRRFTTPVSYLILICKSAYPIRHCQELDVMLYLFWEKTSLRWRYPGKVDFMSWLFSNQMKNSCEDFLEDKKIFKVQGLQHQDGICELPSHWQSWLMWDFDINHMVCSTS